MDNKSEPLQFNNWKKEEAEDKNVEENSHPCLSHFPLFHKTKYIWSGKHNIRKNNFRMRIKSLLNSSSFSHEWICFWFYCFIFFLLFLSVSLAVVDKSKIVICRPKNPEDYKKNIYRTIQTTRGENEITYICGWCKTNVKSHRIISNKMLLDW